MVGVGRRNVLLRYIHMYSWEYSRLLTVARMALIVIVNLYDKLELVFVDVLCGK